MVTQLFYNVFEAEQNIVHISWGILCIRSPLQCLSYLVYPYGPLIRCIELRVAHAPGNREHFSHQLALAIPTCITARASSTCRDACRDRYLSVAFEVGSGKNVPGIPGADDSIPVKMTRWPQWLLFRQFRLSCKRWLYLTSPSAFIFSIYFACPYSIRIHVVLTLPNMSIFIQSF